MITNKTDFREDPPNVDEVSDPRASDASSKGAVLDTLEKRAEVLLRIVPVALAGGGSVTQATQIDEWLDILGSQHNIPVRRIGVAGPRPDFVDEQVTGVVYPLDRYIQQANTVSDIYRQVCMTLADELSYLHSRGIRHFTAVCCGYTSYGLFGLHRGLEKLNASHSSDPMTGNVIIQDSSFPDIDILDKQVDQQGYPLTRFYGPAYQSTPHLRIVFTLNGAIPFDVYLSRRRPPGCIPLMTALPYTPRYIATWQNRAKLSKAEARERLRRVLPTITNITPADYVIPLLASGGCWEEASVGKWMTREQFNTVQEGTLTLVKALCFVAQHSGRRVFMPLIRQGASFVLAQQMSDVYSIEQVPLDVRTGVIVLPYDTLPQPSFIDLVSASDLVVHRTVQTNSFAETIFARIPLLVMTIPAAGYMDSEIMARAMSRGLLAYDQDSIEIGAQMYRILTEPDYRDTLIKGLEELFTGMYSQPESNFGAILAQVAGVELSV